MYFHMVQIIIATLNAPPGSDVGMTMFLVKGPPRKGTSDSASDKAITYIVAIPLNQSSSSASTTKQPSPYLYDIPLHEIDNPKPPWKRSNSRISVLGTSSWATTFSISENITKYFYGAAGANPIGKYVSIKGAGTDNWVWCDDYYKLGQHNYIFIGGGKDGVAAVDTCGILDIQIKTTLVENKSVFTATYSQGPSMTTPRFAAGGAITTT